MQGNFIFSMKLHYAGNFSAKLGKFFVQFLTLHPGTPDLMLAIF
jgi:hypothetical protein